MKAASKLMGILLSTLMFQIGLADDRERIVISPTGIFPTDVENIQEAVDVLGADGRDGVIVLQSRNIQGVPTAFNFKNDGDPSQRGSVLINAAHSGALELRGESDEDSRTTIVGGHSPIHMQRRDELTIRSIVFQEAFLRAIFIEASTNIVIKENVMIDTLGFEDIFPQVRIIYLRGLSSDPDQITGKIIIEDNIIDGATAGYSEGISTFFTSAETWITDNRISGVNLGVRHNGFVKPLHLYENLLEAFVPAPFVFAAGAQVGCDIGDEAVSRIVDNRVSVVDEASQGEAVGLDLAAFDSVEPDCDVKNAIVTDNEITTVNGFAGADIFAISEVGPARALHNVISDNEFRGNSLFGIFLGGLDLSPGGATHAIEVSNNLVAENDFENLQAAEATVFLDEFTSNNLIAIEEGEIVIDLGVGNVTTISDEDDVDDDDDDESEESDWD